MVVDTYKKCLDDMHGFIRKRYMQLLYQYINIWKQVSYLSNQAELEDITTKRKYWIYPDEYGNKRKLFWDLFFQRMEKFIDEVWAFAESQISRYKITNNIKFSNIETLIKEEIEKIIFDSKRADLAAATYILSGKVVRGAELDEIISSNLKNNILHNPYGNIFVEQVRKHHSEKVETVMSLIEKDFKNISIPKFSENNVKCFIKRVKHLWLEDSSEHLTFTKLFNIINDKGGLITESILNEHMNKILSTKKGSVLLSDIPKEAIFLGDEKVLLIQRLGKGEKRDAVLFILKPGVKNMYDYSLCRVLSSLGRVACT